MRLLQAIYRKLARYQRAQAGDGSPHTLASGLQWSTSVEHPLVPSVTAALMQSSSASTHVTNAGPRLATLNVCS